MPWANISLQKSTNGSPKPEPIKSVKPKPPRAVSPKRIHVSGLPLNQSEQLLGILFFWSFLFSLYFLFSNLFVDFIYFLGEFIAKSCGEISQVRIITDADGNSKGFAYVDFLSEDSVSKAIQLEDKNFEGQALKISQAYASAQGS